MLLSGTAQAGPLSERVVVVSPVNGRQKLFWCRIDGRDLVRLSRVKGDQFEPDFSATLNRVFFVRRERGRDQICSVDLEGEDLQVHIKGPFHARQPNAHPDGQRVVFSTDRWGAFELAEFDLKSQTITRLTYGQAISTHPRYSPKGDRILFLSRRHGQTELYLLEPKERAFTRLTQSPFHEGPGRWSPDGSRIVATRVMPPKKLTRLLELDLESGQERLLLHKVEQLQSPTYSADGTLMLFIWEDELLTYDASDTAAEPFPLRGKLTPLSVLWITVPLP